MLSELRRTVLITQNPRRFPVASAVSCCLDDPSSEPGRLQLPSRSGAEPQAGHGADLRGVRPRGGAHRLLPSSPSAPGHHSLFKAQLSCHLLREGFSDVFMKDGASQL